MSITLVVSLTNAISVSVGVAKATVVTAVASEARIVRFIICLVGFVIRLQSNVNSRYPAILIYEDYVENIRR